MTAKITLKQYRLYMDKRKNGKTQVIASAQAGISLSTAKRIERGELTEDHSVQRTWKTHEDIFASVWEEEIEPLLKEHQSIQAKTILEQLIMKFPDQYQWLHLRTLQRRVKKWRVLHGEDKEVIFRQEHLPGEEGYSDFTHPDYKITIKGEELSHMLYHFRLGFSGWSFAHIILGGESFTALAEHLQKALYKLGGVPEEHRTDSLTAAYKNKDSCNSKDLTRNYLEFCKIYQIIPTRNNKGIAHENGSIESPHGHLKSAIKQALMIRGSKDFSSIEDYQSFIDKIVEKKNYLNRHKVEIERKHLKKLPQYQAFDYELKFVKVASTSTINLKHVVYSVPSRLIGCELEVHLYDNRLECFYQGEMTCSLKRIRIEKGKTRARSIDYRHLIKSLRKKPMAFEKYIFQKDLFPTFSFKMAWERLEQTQDMRMACKTYVELLAIASQYDLEQKLSNHLEELLASGEIPNIDRIRKAFSLKASSATLEQKVEEPSLEAYEEFLRGGDSL